MKDLIEQRKKAENEAAALNVRSLVACGLGSVLTFQRKLSDISRENTQLRQELTSSEERARSELERRTQAHIQKVRVLWLMPLVLTCRYPN